MKKVIYLLILLIILLLLRSKVKSYSTKYTISDSNKIGYTNVVNRYGDSIGWYNKNGTHVFFSKNSRIDTLK